MNVLPEDMNPDQRSLIEDFLRHLEQQGRSLLRLAPSSEGKRPVQIEEAVIDACILDHRRCAATLAALNQGFGFELQIEHLIPMLAEHTALLEGLSQKLDHTELLHIRRLLIYLEREGHSWSQLAPADDTYLYSLSRLVEKGIRDHSLYRDTFITLNRAFGMYIRRMPRANSVKPSLPEHIKLASGLRPNLPYLYDLRIRNFLLHLERRGYSFSQMVSTPHLLEKIVNKGIRDKTFQNSTRAALNYVFGLDLKSDAQRRHNELFPEHAIFMGKLPQPHPEQRYHHYLLRTFLLHLQSKGLSLWQLLPANKDMHPHLLEQVVNTGIRDKVLDNHTLKALNLTLNLRLRSDDLRPNEPTN